MTFQYLIGEFKCLNCRYETNCKSHLDAHMRLHPEKPFHCMFCNYASYWRGDTKKHIEKNHPERVPNGINPYNLVEKVFEVYPSILWVLVSVDASFFT